LAAAGAAVAALAATAAAPAAAGTPVGERIAEGALQQPVIDHDSGRIAYVAAPRLVRVVDGDGTTHRDLAIPADCVQPAWTPALTGAGEGQLLLACEQSDSFDISPGRPFTRSWIAPRLLDEQSGAIAPVGDPASPIWGRAVAVVRAGVVIEVAASGREPGYSMVIDPRTGATSSAEGSWPLDTGIVLRTERGLANTMPLTASFRDCRAELTWTVGVLAQAWPLADAMLISEASYGGSPLTLTRVALDGVCERTAARWPLRASARGRAVTALARTAAVPDAATGAVAGLAPTRAAAPRLRVTRGGRVRLRTASAADDLRWRVAGGRWRAASGGGSSWTATLPARLRGTRAAELETRLTDGGTVRHALRLTVVGR